MEFDTKVTGERDRRKPQGTKGREAAAMHKGVHMGVSGRLRGGRVPGPRAAIAQGRDLRAQPIHS